VDVEEIRLRIASDSPRRAERWAESIACVMAALSRFPRRYPLAPEAREIGREVRHAIHGAYRILFAIKGDVVVVLHVRHGARRTAGAEELG
jgi:plasmid stabilization system protein ParE